jgi:hypothetical protein
MANRIYVHVHGTQKILDMPLIEDVTFEIGSEFSTFGELSSSISRGADILKIVDSTTQKISSDKLTSYTALDVPRWIRTHPLKLNLKLAFYTQTSAEKDVFNPMTFLMSLSILTKTQSGSYALPGIGLKNISNALDLDNSDLLKSGSSLQSAVMQEPNVANGVTLEDTDFPGLQKLVSVEIPGMVYLQNAYIVTCTPILSKQKTDKGYPLWGNMDIVISGVGPATTEIFRNVKTALTNESFYNLPV